MPREEVSDSIGSKTIIRIIIFFIIIYLSITYLSRDQKIKRAIDDPTVLGEEITATGSYQLKSFFDNIYNSLPANSRQQIENIDQSPAIIYVQEKYAEITDQINGFPDRQINQFKKDIINTIYKDLMKDIKE